MIKWAGYGKSLKQLFFGLLISCFTLLGGSFVSAFEYSQFNTVSVNSFPSPLNNQYDITFLKGGGLKSSFLGYSRNIFALTDNVLFWWAPNGLPYLYLYSTTNSQSTLLYNGYFKTASSCDSLSSGGNYVIPANCSSFSLWNGAGPTIFKNFFTNVNLNDVVYYKYYNDANDIVRFTITFDLCFNSEIMDKSMCFSFNDSYFSSDGINLSGSLDLQGGDSFMTIPYDVVGYAPGQNGYMGDYGGDSNGSVEVGGSSGITGDYVYGVCTNGSVKNYMESQGMNKYICYAGLSVSDTGLQIAVPGDGSSVFDLFQSTNSGQNFQEWFTYWNNIYKNRYVYSDTFWRNNPSALYSYFEIYNQYGGQFSYSDVQDYCRLVVNDISLTGNYTGKSKRCASSINGNGAGGGAGSSWGDDETNGEIPVGVNWAGVGNMSGSEEKDGITFIQDFFNKIKEVIPTDYNGVGGGVLPTYIILFFCALVIFRFISR